MVILDYGAGAVLRQDGNRGLDIELVIRMGQSYADHLPFNQFLGPCNGFCIKVMQHFKSVGRLAADSSQSRCNMKADHPCTRNSYSHSVLENVSADLYLDFKI